MNKSTRPIEQRQPAPAPALPSSTEQMILGLMQQQVQLMAGQQLLLEWLRDLLPICRTTIIHQHGNYNSANVESQVNACRPVQTGKEVRGE